MFFFTEIMIISTDMAERDLQKHISEDNQTDEENFKLVDQVFLFLNLIHLLFPIFLKAKH